MRQLGWVLFIGAVPLAASLFFFDLAPVEYLYKIFFGLFISGLAILQVTKVIPIDEGEILFFKGASHATNNSKQGKGNKAYVKLAVTSKGLRYSDYFGSQQNLVPYAGIIDAQRLGPGSVLVNLRGEAAEEVSLQFQFPIILATRVGQFLRALECNGVTIGEGL